MIIKKDIVKILALKVTSFNPTNTSLRAQF